MKKISYLVVLLATILQAQTGPGGVSSINTGSSLVLWLDASKLNLTNNSTVSTWTDESSYGNNASSSTGNEPVFKTNTLNGYPVLRFTESNENYMRITHNSNLNPDELSYFIVARYTNAIDDYTPIFIKTTSYSWNDGYGFASDTSPFFGGNFDFFAYIDDWDEDQNVEELQANNYNIIHSSYNQNKLRLFYNEQGGNVYVSNSYTKSTNDLLIGISPDNAGTGVRNPFDGDIAEIILFNTRTRSAARRIISNYLSAKYNIPLSNRDYYTMDDSGNGNFDFNVAGIGYENSNNFVDEAQGTGVVKIKVPNSSLGTNFSRGDYLFWGENVKDATYEFNLNASNLRQLNTKWRVSERNEVGNVNVSVKASDINFMSNDGCNDLKLIVSSSSDFSSKTTYNMTLTAGEYVATNVSFNNADFFTFEYFDDIILDSSGFYGGSGTGGAPSVSDGCYNLLIKSNAVGNDELTQNANVRSIEVESNGNFVIDDGYRIQVSNGIQLDGDIRLLGDAQIIQTHSGTSLVSGSGKLYRDQATATNDSYGGTANYKSLYWSSPVSSSGSPGTFTIADVLKDGTNPTTVSSTPVNIDFISNWNGDDSSPIKISRRWLGKLINAISWTQEIDPNTETFNVGEGWNMKSTDANNQNFTFYGIPNDGNYAITGVNDYVYFVLGNPYPSAFDAYQFINDNEDVLNPTMYFYDSTYDYSHYYQEFAGGYGYIQKTGGTFTAMKAPGGVETKLPRQYLPIGQGFLMYSLETIAPTTTREIVFNNNQRIFKKRSDTDSEFIARTATSQKNEETIPLLKIGFEFLVEELGKQQRSLAIVFCGQSSELDKGSDAYLLDKRPIDLVLRTPSNKNVMLGVSAIEKFNADLEIPLALYLNKDKEVTFKIIEKKDFPATDIYLKDAETNQYYNISNTNLSVNIELPQGNYLDRFSVVFKKKSSLSTDDITTDKNLNVFVDKVTNEIVIQQKNHKVITVRLFNLVGQEIVKWNNTKMTSEIRFKKDNLQTSSVYILKLKTEEGKEVIKKVVLN